MSVALNTLRKHASEIRSLENYDSFKDGDKAYVRKHLCGGRTVEILRQAEGSNAFTKFLSKIAHAIKNVALKILSGVRIVDLETTSVEARMEEVRANIREQKNNPAVALLARTILEISSKKAEEVEDKKTEEVEDKKTEEVEDETSAAAEAETPAAGEAEEV